MTETIAQAQGTSESLSPFTHAEDGLLLQHARDIRLLSLQVDHGGKLRCILRVANLDEAPGFNALSYTWGPPTRAEVMRLGGVSMNEHRSRQVVSRCHFSTTFNPSEVPWLLSWLDQSEFTMGGEEIFRYPNQPVGS